MHSASSVQSLMRRPGLIHRPVEVGTHPPKKGVKENEFHTSCSSLFDSKKSKGQTTTDRKLGESFTSLNASFASLGSTASWNDGNESNVEGQRRKQERQRERALQAEADRWSNVKASLKPIPSKTTPPNEPSKGITSTDSSVDCPSGIRQSPLLVRETEAASPKSPKRAPKALTKVPKSPTKAPKSLTKASKSSKTLVNSASTSRRSVPPATYTTRQIQAASRIAALARGKRARRQLYYRRLQSKLANMERDTTRDIKRIQKQTIAAQKELKSRATERFRKNLNRKGESDALIQDSHDMVATIRKENASLRERNQKLYAEISKLKTNNERLEASNLTGTECIDRIVCYDESCVVEHDKLAKIHGTYEAAVAEHTAHCQLHATYGETEHKTKLLYRTLLAKVLDRVEGYRDQEVVDEIYTAVEELENLWGKVPRDIDEEKKEKKSKKEKKEGKKKKDNRRHS